ncbi:unnamed protein product [Protopolystoma xenopodis]|uniref:Uncharacterized protein n=1 Tax=Protopolystoma xenopodis TaxID=117903 RepID=A0A3S5BSL2_9PLAT|nr:unnamed protein product [Protopolystoma xenopodis]
MPTLWAPSSRLLGLFYELYHPFRWVWSTSQVQLPFFTPRVDSFADLDAYSARDPISPFRHVTIVDPA